MDLKKLQDLALKNKHLYDKLNQVDGHKVWGSSEYMLGFAGDVGDLSKLIMAKNKLRRVNSDLDLDAAISHELSDCLCSILVLAKEYDMDLTY